LIKFLKLLSASNRHEKYGIYTSKDCIEFVDIFTVNMILKCFC